MEISFIKGEEISREAITLPAEIYNKFHTLLSHADKGYVFVPIRNLQYLAVIDKDEVLFIDGHVKHIVVVAWESFKPQVRESLSEPVPYELVVYDQRADPVVLRLQGEFFKAVELLVSREMRPDLPSGVTSIADRKN